jgi:hypothetical protein
MPDNLVPNGMAYRNSTQTTAGQTSGSNPPGKLWLPIWSGEVINAYDEFNQFEGLVTNRTIPSGTTVEIPVTGTVGLNASWDAGEELVGGTSTASTFQIKLDNRPMAAHFEIDNVDLMLSQWEFRSELARQAALTLANARDKQFYSAIVQAALQDKLTNDPRPNLNLDSALFGNTDLANLGLAGASDANRATAAIKVLAEVEKYIVYLQENNISYDKLFLAVNPQAFMDIRALGVARTTAEFADGGNQPFFGGVAQEGGLGAPYTQSLGKLQDTLEYMGCTIIKSNRVVHTDQSAATDVGEAKYQVDYAAAKVMGAMFTPECVAGIRLQGLKVDTVDDVRRNTTFTVASMMSGTGIMRPECAAIISGLDVSATATDTRAEFRAAGKADIGSGIGFAQA